MRRWHPAGQRLPSRTDTVSCLRRLSSTEGLLDCLSTQSRVLLPLMCSKMIYYYLGISVFHHVGGFFPWQYYTFFNFFPPHCLLPSIPLCHDTLEVYQTLSDSG